MEKLTLINFILISELGNSNPVLRGVAFQQLLGLAQREKSPYSLVAPDIPSVALHIASNCVKQPLLLSEFCRFISYSPSSFLAQTLLEYLPALVARRAGDELSAIARITETTVAALIIEKPAEVLERVFMLDGDAETEKALRFVLDYLPSGTLSSQRGLGISTLVKSKLISLLGRLVIQLGDENPVVQEQVSPSWDVMSYLTRERRCQRLGRLRNMRTNPRPLGTSFPTPPRRSFSRISWELYLISIMNCKRDTANAPLMPNARFCEESRRSSRVLVCQFPS